MGFGNSKIVKADEVPVKTHEKRFDGSFTTKKAEERQRQIDQMRRERLKEIDRMNKLIEEDNLTRNFFKEATVQGDIKEKKKAASVKTKKKDAGKAKPVKGEKSAASKDTKKKEEKKSASKKDGEKKSKKDADPEEGKKGDKEGKKAKKGEQEADEGKKGGKVGKKTTTTTTTEKVPGGKQKGEAQSESPTAVRGKAGRGKGGLLTVEEEGLEDVGEIARLRGLENDEEEEDDINIEKLKLKFTKEQEACRSE